MNGSRFSNGWLVLALSSLVACRSASDLERRGPVENPEAPAAAQGRGGADHAEAESEWSMGQVGRELAQTGHLLHPAGETLRVSGRVMDLAAGRAGKFLVVKTDQGPAVIDAAAFRVLKQYEVPGHDPKSNWSAFGGSMHGIAVAADGTGVYLTAKARHLLVASLGEDGALTFGPSVDLSIDKRDTNPLGVALVPGGRFALVALALANQAALVDLGAGRVVKNIPVGVCPYGVAVSRDGKTAFVSNFGGPHPRKGDRTDKTAGTEMAVDERSVALRGSVSVIDVAQQRVVGEIETRIHPECMVLSPDGRTLYVVDAGGDGVTMIDVERRAARGTLDTRPEAGLPYGSLSCGLALAEDGRTLFAANAGNNAVAMLYPAQPAAAPFGLVAAGGYPGSLCVQGDTLFIGNVLGFAGSLQKVQLPRDPAERGRMTAEARTGFHLSEILRAQARARSGVAPRPVPANPGEPSPIRHVVYIIKENKKFDQVMGDIGRGNCEPKFCEFPRKATPNAHALADEFVLLDNYYCGGVNSSVGHQWATQGLTTPYREKDWGNTHGTYSFGHDPLAFAGCGFIWDHVLRHGLSFRNFGELGDGVVPKGSTWTEHYRAWREGRTDFSCAYRVSALRNYSDLRFPGWELSIPDQVRADVFLKALGEFEAAGRMPELVVVYLPNDHTQGGSVRNPTPRAYVADNDLALGRVIEALSKSRFWKDMVVIANEDDPQTGADHVDGHRSICMLAGPYVRRGGAVVSRFYNQSSVLHTICRILGVPPMNQVVAMAPVMAECFQDVPDFAPYVCRPATLALDELNPEPGKAPSKTQARLAPLTEKLDFSGPDRIDRDAVLFSRWVWSTVRGDEAFPVAYVGAHGRGLKALGLQLAEDDGDDD